MRGAPALAAAVALGLGTALAGCHTYQPTTVSALAPGDGVRARVSGAWADSLESVVFRDARILQGTVVERRPGGVLLELPVRTGDARQAGTLSQRVELPASAFMDVELRDLDRTRTGIALGVGGLAAALLVIDQLSGRSGGAQGPGGPGPVEIRLPLGLGWGGR